MSNLKDGESVEMQDYMMIARHKGAMRFFACLAGIALLISGCSADGETSAELERVKSELTKAQEELQKIKLAARFAQNKCLRKEFAKAADQMQGTKPQPDRVMEQVVVLIKDRPAGTKITADDVAQIDVDPRYINSNMVRPKEFEKFEGREIAIPLVEKDFLLRSFFGESEKKE